MKLAPLLSRHRRLLALCGLSAAVHLLVLEVAARRDALPPAAPPAGEALRLRLTRESQPAASAPAAPARPARPPAAGPVPSTRTPAPASASAAKDASVVSAPAPAPSAAPAEASPEPAGKPRMQMPGRYRVRMPDSTRLSYTLTQQTPAAAPIPGGDASIAWRNEGEHYALALDGVLGKLSSEGVGGDAGIVPRLAAEERDGARLVTEFDSEGNRIVFRAGGASAPLAIGVQDRASVLMQLAGIGLGEPDQIAGQLNRELRIVVAGVDGAEIARYQVMGKEEVQTGLGAVEAWRLAQVTPAGQDRLEVWLAPARGWLPVQLRLVRADGRAATQTLTRIEPGAPR